MEDMLEGDHIPEGCCRQHTRWGCLEVWEVDVKLGVVNLGG